MKRFQGCCFILLIFMAEGVQIEDTLAKMEKTTFGLNILKTISIKFKQGDPIDRIVRQIESIRNTSEAEQGKIKIKMKKLTQDCEEAYQLLKDNIGKLDYKTKDTFSTLMNKKPLQEQSVQRLATKQDLVKQLRNDLQRQIELRETQATLYEYNVDKLEKALFAITEVKKLFVKYIKNQQHRRRLLGNADSFLQGKGIDIESALNEDYRDDVEDDDDLDERRQHYQMFVFVEITVGIKKVRESLKGLSGIEALMDGFEEIASTLHSVHTHDEYSQVSFIQEGSDSEQTVEEISQLVVDVSTHINDWIAQLRRWEDTTEDAKKHMSNKLQKMIKQHLSETQIEVDQLDGETRALSLSVNNLKNSKDNSGQRLESQKTELEDKQNECAQQQFEFEQDFNNIDEEKALAIELLEILEQKGGQLRSIIAQKVYG